MNSKQCLCQQCAFAKCVPNNDGYLVQTGCYSGQLEKYNDLKDKIDPNGQSLNNSVFKMVDMEEGRYYVINYACPFQRSKEWAEEYFEKPIAGLDHKWLREHLITIIPFDYALVVISDGNTKHTIRSCKSVINATVPPQFFTVVYPYKWIADKGKEELFLALDDRLKKGDIEKPDPQTAPSFAFDIRQIVDPNCVSVKDMVYDAIKAKSGYFWILTLQAGSKVDPGFIESIKRKVLDLTLDFTIISLSIDEALIPQPIFTGAVAFHPSGAFKYKNSTLVQEYDINYLSSFFNIIDE